MKKLMKRIGAVLMAVAMMAALGVSAWAAAPPVGAVTQDTDVSVTGLIKDDQVKFTQIIKWVDGEGWSYVDGLDTAATAAGVNLPTLETITGKVNPPNSTPAYTAGAISAEHAAILAKAAAKLTGAGVVTRTVAADTDGKATYTDAPAGLYYAQVIPATADYLYNTIFVGADFKSNGSNTIAADTAKVGNENNAVAKREKISLDKESMPDATGTNLDNIKYDHNVGDVIDFKITSFVPAYADGYIEPHYILTDALEDGLVLVKEKNVDLTDTNIYDSIAVSIEGVTNLVNGTDYTLAKDGNGFKLTMNATGLAKVKALGQAAKITVTYKAQIKSLDEGNVTVTEKTNTATVDFSNKPTDKDSFSLIEDRTRHYSFSLDANLLGTTGNEYVTDELIKVGRDGQGNLLEKQYDYRSDTTWTKLSPLENAKFALFTANPEAADYKDEAAALASGKLYTNSSFNGIVKSDATGHLNITGLDEGTYYLREVSAPTGYVKDNRTFKIDITAEYDEITAGSYNKDIPADTAAGIAARTVKVNYGAYKVLKKQVVAVTPSASDGTYPTANTTTSTYTIEKKGDVQTQVVDKATFKEVTGQTGPFAGDSVTPINNTQGTELPSTGGIGTYIFTITGVAIMAIAAGLLIVRHKKKAE